jgi:TP901 family phage tail tape measure protein
MMGYEVAEISLAADYSMLAQGLRAATNLVRGFATGASHAMSKLNLAPKDAKQGQSWMGVKGGQLAGRAAMGGLDWMIDQGKAVFEFEDRLTEFGVATRKSGAGLREIAAAARATSTSIGTDATEVLAAAKAYTDLAGAENFTIGKMNTLSRAARASAADTTDLAGMMYQLTRSMKVTDDQMEDTMGGLINQAKDGAIEAKQMAREFSAMLPLFARFKGATGREGALQVGAMFQVVRDNFNSADEAGTGLVRVLAGLRTYGSRFEKHGVRIWDIDENGVKKARNFSDIFEDLSKSDLIKDPEKLKKAFGRTEGWRAMELLLENVPRLRELEESGRRNGVIMEDLGTVTTSTGGRIKIAVEKIKNGFAEALTPERIDSIVGGIEAITSSIGPLLSAVSSVAGTFDSFLKNVARAKQAAAGSYHASASDEEKEFQQYGFRLQHSDPARFKQLQAKYGDGRLAKQRDAENAARDELVGAEDAFGPTDQAIKRAIRYAKASMRPDAPAGETADQGAQRRAQSSAALWYLEQRKGEIPEARYKRLEAELQAESKAEADAAAKKATAGIASAAEPPWLQKFAQMVGDAVKGKPTVVSVDGNQVAKADANATDKRRR